MWITDLGHGLESRLFPGGALLVRTQTVTFPQDRAPHGEATGRRPSHSVPAAAERQSSRPEGALGAAGPSSQRCWAWRGPLQLAGGLGGGPEPSGHGAVVSLACSSLGIFAGGAGKGRKGRATVGHANPCSSSQGRKPQQRPPWPSVAPSTPKSKWRF